MVGFGYDLHRLAKGESLIIGGITIDSNVGTIAHSDGDVLIHAIIDALLGAAGLGDIGEHFPDTDEKYKNASSVELLINIISLIKDNGFKLINIDSTIVLQSIKLKDYKPLMREKLSEICGLPINKMGIKAKTNETIGCVGRDEGVVAFAVCQLETI